MYETLKNEFLTNFLDQYDLAVNRKNGDAIDQGDSAWRTGLATISMAIEKDHSNTARFLKALSTHCWVDGRPVRHPNWETAPEKKYSRDQFIPQMAACYYAWKFGNDETRQLAMNLLKRFIDVLLANNWWLNTGWAALVLPPTQFVLREVASKMGLKSDWEVQGEDLIGAGNIFISNIVISIAKVKSGGDDPSEFYSIHNLFWEILLLYECRNHTNLLKQTTGGLYEVCKKHNMALLYWIVGDFGQPREWLADWPSAWNHCSYVWQRTLSQQNESPSADERYPRLDYMVLSRLFDLEIER